MRQDAGCSVPRSQFRAALLAAVATVLAAGCGGGGGSAPIGTPSAPPPSAPSPAPTPTPSPPPPVAAPGWANATEIFVGAADSLWHFAGSDSRGRLTPESYRATTRVEAVADVQGRVVSRFRFERYFNEREPLVEWRYADATGVRAIEVPSLTPPSSLDAAVTDLRSPIQKDDRYVAFESTSASTDYDGDGVRDQEALRITRAVLAIEPVTVPAGTVTEAARIESVATATVTLSRNGQVVSATATQVEWHAKGLGVVKRQFTDPNFPAPNNVVTEELIGIEAPTAAAGVGREFVLEERLPPRALPNYEVASDGTDLLYVTQRTVPPALAPTQLVARLYSPSGTVKWERTILDAANADEWFGSMAVGFGNGHFHLLAEAKRSDGSSARLIRQRFNGAGDRLDGPYGATIVEQFRVELAPARPRFGGDRVLYAWRMLGLSNGFIRDAVVLLSNVDMTPIALPTKVATSDFVPQVEAIAGRPGEFAVLSEGNRFRIDRNGLATPLPPLSLAFLQRYGVTAAYGDNVLNTWLGDGSSDGGNHLLYGSLLFSDVQAGIVSTEARLLATASRSSLTYDISWTAAATLSTGVILAFTEMNNSGHGKVKTVWMPNVAGPLLPQPGLPLLAVNADEYQLTYLKAAAASTSAFVARQSQPAPLSGPYLTSVVVVRPPFAR